MTKNKKAIKYIEKQKTMYLVMLTNLKQNTKGIKIQEYNRIRRELSETILVLDYILMKL